MQVRVRVRRRLRALVLGGLCTWSAVHGHGECVHHALSVCELGAVGQHNLHRAHASTDLEAAKPSLAKNIRAPGQTRRVRFAQAPYR